MPCRCPLVGSWCGEQTGCISASMRHQIDVDCKCCAPMCLRCWTGGPRCAAVSLICVTIIYQTGWNDFCPFSSRCPRDLYPGPLGVAHDAGEDFPPGNLLFSRGVLGDPGNKCAPDGWDLVRVGQSEERVSEIWLRSPSKKDGVHARARTAARHGLRNHPGEEWVGEGACVAREEGKLARPTLPTSPGVEECRHPST